MIVPDVTDFFFSKLIEGVESYLNPLGYVIMLCNSRHSQENEIKYLQELSHRSVDGILLATPNILPEKYALDSGFYQKMPIILIDRGLNRRDNGRLIVKEYEGAYQAVSLFIESGHTKIGMLKETTGYYQLEERFNGYRHALKDHGLPFNGKFVEHGELTVQGGYTGLKLSEYMIPQLTTVQQPSFDIGFYAARFLIDTIEFPQRKVPNKVFETKLIIRESVKVLTKG